MICCWCPTLSCRQNPLDIGRKGKDGKEKMEESHVIRRKEERRKQIYEKNHVGRKEGREALGEEECAREKTRRKESRIVQEIRNKRNGPLEWPLHTAYMERSEKELHCMKMAPEITLCWWKAA